MSVNLFCFVKSQLSRNGYFFHKWENVIYRFLKSAAKSVMLLSNREDNLINWTRISYRKKVVDYEQAKEMNFIELESELKVSYIKKSLSH